MNAVKSRRFRVLASTVGLWLAQTVPGWTQPPAAPQAEPSRLQLTPAPASPNQQLADACAAHLRQSGQLKGYRIDLRVEGGIVELTGQVADQAQREEAVRIVQGVPGVERVRDHLTLPAGAVRPVTATTQPIGQEPRPLPNNPTEGPGGPLPGGPPPEPYPIFHAPPGGGPGGQFGGPMPGHMPPPPMPPYAWPTYAPYNNFSRVATPELYPYQSWPFIGPMYPFPKVPLGWRSVNLRWMDGHWWYGRTATGHDWWRVRYW
jgi:hypothetical protein